jgi:hypothetical protein
MDAGRVEALRENWPLLKTNFRTPGVPPPLAGGDTDSLPAIHADEGMKREVTGTIRHHPSDGVDADSRAVAGYSRDQRPSCRVLEAGGWPPELAHNLHV